MDQPGSNIDFVEYITERTKEFTGRDWVFQALNDWLADASGGRRFLLTGGPGSGKSALAARLVQMSLGDVPAAGFPFLGVGSLAYHHFCRAFMDTTLSPQRFVEHLAHALAARYEPFRAALQMIVEHSSSTSIQATVTQTINEVQSGAQVTGVNIQVRVGSISARAAFDLLVRQPLQKIYADGFGEQIVLVVDSLDEALTYDPDDNITNLLSVATDLPPKVRFILSSRPDDQVLSLINGKTLDLIDDAPMGNEDVRQYAFRRLAVLPEPRRSTFADRVAGEASGNFLYTRYVLDDLLPGIEQVADLDALPLPANLEDQYRNFLQRELARNVKEWLKDYAPIFGVLAAARGQGLSLTQIAGVTGRPLSEASLLLSACDQYLVGPQPQGPFRIYHQSFRDFLLKDETYPIFPGEAEASIGDFFLKRCGKDWTRCSVDYALRYTPTHLAEAARLDAQFQGHDYAEKLVRLVLSKDYQQGFLSSFSDPIALQRSLELALQTVSQDEDMDALPLVVETALALDAYRRKNLQPRPVFDLARAGDVELAENRLALFGLESRWRQMILLTIAWVAAKQDPDGARALYERVKPSIDEPDHLELLAQRVETTLDNTDFPQGLLPPLPPDPGYGPVREIVNRMGGGEYNPSFLMEFGAELNVQEYEMLMNEYNVVGATEGSPAYVGEYEGPLLVAHAVSDPQEGTRLLQEYLELHAVNNYVLYRNRSLWGLLGAVLSHPDQAWVQSMLPALAEAALTGNRLFFKEGLNTSLLAFTGDPDPQQVMQARAKQALEAADALPTSHEKGDAWGSHARRLAALAEAYALALGDTAQALHLLERALDLPRGFAGFRAPLCLTLAEALHICRDDGGRIDKALQAGLEAAHNITDPIFCVRMTARINAMQVRYWAAPVPAFNVQQEVEDFLLNPQGPVRAALHVIGDGYTGRKVAMPVSLPLPPACYKAETLEDLSGIYQQPLAEFRRLNPGLAVDQPLPQGAHVNVPDPEFSPLLAARLAAEALVSGALSDAQRSGLVQSLVPVATADPTVMYTLLGRLVLAAGIQDSAMPARLARLIPE